MDLLSLATGLQKTFAASQAAGQGGLLDAALSPAVAKLSDSTITSWADKIAQAGGAAAGAAACVAAGAAPLAPVCSAAGAWAADKVVGAVKAIGSVLFARAGGGAGEDDPSGATTFCADVALLQAKRAAVLSAEASAGDDATALSEIRALAAAVAPIPGTADWKFLRPKMEAPGGLGYAHVLALSPADLLPSDFGAQGKSPNGNCVYFEFIGSAGWQARLIDALVAPFLAANLPVKYAADQLKKEYGSAPWWTLLGKAAELLLPKIDEWVAGRLKWIFEQAALRRAARAVTETRAIRKSLAELHPDWNTKELDKAQETLIRAVQSGNPTYLAQEVAQLQSKDAKPGPTVGITRKGDPGYPESMAQEEGAPKKKKGGGGGAAAGLALLVLLGVAASRK